MDSLPDAISKLCDDILIDILSRLSMKEAARTGILSHHWENLWKSYTGCLDFDDLCNSKLFLFFRKGRKMYEIEHRRYERWVNQVLVSHRAPSIEQFRVCYDLGKERTNSIDSWIAFAAAKGVRRLELDLTSINAPDKIVKHVKDLEEIYNFPTDELLFVRLKLLTSFRLEAVNITEEQVLSVLSGCPSLEELSIAGAPSLRKLKIVGGSDQSPLKLKHLEIRRCLGLERLEVSAARNLVSFRYHGKFYQAYQDLPMETNMHFENVPQLSSAYIGFSNDTERMIVIIPYSKSFLFLSHSYGCCHSIGFRWCLIDQPTSYIVNLHISFFLTEIDDLSMLFVGLFLRASPRLRKLVLKYNIHPKGTDGDINGELVYRSIFKEFSNKHEQLVRGCKYESLKEVEFLGWTGFKCEVELFTHLVEAAETLERLTVNPLFSFYPPYFRKEMIPSFVNVDKEVARNRARDLEPKLSPPTKLVVL